MAIDSKKTTSAADKRLIAFLQKRGKPGVERLQQVQEWAATDGAPLIEALDRKGVINEDDLADALARELRLPLLNLPTLSVDDQTVKLIKEQLATKHLVMPVRSEGHVLILAMANPFDIEVVKTVEFTTGKQVRPAVAVRSHIKDAIDHYYRFDSSLRTLLADVPGAGPVAVLDRPTDDGDEARSLSRSAEEAPIVKMVNLILGEAVKAKASDIHIEPGPNVTLVRYRINGMLEDALQVPKWVQSPVVARIKVMAKLDITEHRVPQDGGIRVRFHDRLVDLRVSSLPTNYGEKMVMRVLDPGVSLRRLEDIGLSPRDAKILRSAIAKPEGMILVTGPTGSGKTTTLYGVIQEIRSPDVNIVTIENPIEYELKGVSQVQVNEKQGLTFAGALRSILRQDPDVILLGEVRDRETAEVAFQAAQTGHLVLSTLHTNDTASTIVRLIDLGIEPYLAASSILAIVAQRLVRTVCARCAEPFEVDEATLKALGLRSHGEFRRGKGCPTCRNSGFDSRTGLYEILEVTDKVAAVIESKTSEANLRQAARKDGMTTLSEDAAAKIEGGRTTPEEVLRVIQVERQGPACPQCGHLVEESFTVCPYCLHQLQLTCPSCEAALKPEWKSCPYCGEVPKKKPPAPAAEPSRREARPEPAAAPAP
ncbi:MAG: ATPase, T2SS/T4P/T4SS family, partial [Candidatus Binatia bacterium]